MRYDYIHKKYNGKVFHLINLIMHIQLCKMFFLFLLHQIDIAMNECMQNYIFVTFTLPKTFNSTLKIRPITWNINGKWHLKYMKMKVLM